MGVNIRVYSLNALKRNKSQVSLYDCLYTRIAVYIRVYSLNALKRNKITSLSLWVCIRVWVCTYAYTALMHSSEKISQVSLYGCVHIQSKYIQLSLSPSLPLPLPLLLSLSLARSLSLTRSLSLYPPLRPSLFKRQSISVLVSTVGLF
jgi:hypothetical protein